MHLLIACHFNSISGHGRLDVLADVHTDDGHPDAAGRRVEVLPRRREADPHGQGAALAEAFEDQAKGGVQAVQRKKKQVCTLLFSVPRYPRYLVQSDRLLKTFKEEESLYTVILCT